MKVKCNILNANRVVNSLPPYPTKAKVVITSNGYVRVIRCSDGEDFDILCRYFDDDAKRQNFADDICEVFYMLDIEHEFIEESK